MAFGAFFTLAGALIMLIPLMAAKFMAKKEAIKKQFPEEPWKWDDRWADGIVKSAGRGGACPPAPRPPRPLPQRPPLPGRGLGRARGGAAAEEGTSREGAAGGPPCGL